MKVTVSPNKTIRQNPAFVAWNKENTEKQLECSFQNQMPGNDEIGKYYEVIKREIKEAALNTSMHGLPSIFRTDIFILKVISSIVLMAAIGGCTYMLILSFQSYFAYNVVTNFDIVNEVPTLFPTVSVCNKNSLSNNLSIQYSQNILHTNYVYDVYNMGLGNDLLANDFARYLYGTNVVNPAVNDSTRQTLGLDLNDMLISCTYNSEPCDASQFNWYFDSVYGNCYQFNSGKNASGQVIDDYISNKPGYLNGLILELYVDSPTDLNSLAIDSGARLVVNNKSTFPSFFDGIILPTGMFSYVAVDRQFVEKKPKPYSDCTSDTDLQNSKSLYVQKILATGYSYRQADCFNVCYQKYMINNCSCNDIGISNVIWNTTAPPCIDLTQLSCDFDNFKGFFKSNVAAYCGDDCPLECDSIQYTLSTSSGTYPNKGYYTRLMNNSVVQKQYNYNTSAITLESLQSNVLGFAVYYTSLSYTKISEDAKMEVADLIGAIGGTLGLFVGLSFMSFYELFELAFTITYIRIISLLCRKKFTIVQRSENMEIATSN